MKRIENLIKTIEPPNWVLFVCFLALILRIPSFFEPYSYGDEMIYLTLGNAIRKGLVLYKEIYDNKPPGIYIIAAFAGNLFWFKAILAFWNLATIVLFSKLVNKLFGNNENLQKVAVLSFAIFTVIPLFEGNIANAELFMIGPVIIAFLILLTKDLTNKVLFISGLIFALGAFFKIPSAFDIPAIFVYWLIAGGINKNNILLIFRRGVVLIAGFAVPFAISFVYFGLKGALPDFIAASFLQNFGYLSSWRPSTQPFLVKNLPLILRGLTVFSGIIILYFSRKKISKEFLFVCLWLLMALFGVTLSERPYPHYFLQAIPAVSILIGMLVSSKTIEQLLAIIPITLAVFVPVYFKFWYYPTTPYYQKFINFTLGKMSKDSFLRTFGGDVPINYKISEIIIQSRGENSRIFVEGDSSVIYALTRRLPPIKYVADYHIKDYSSPEKELQSVIKNRPEYIVIKPGSFNFSFFTRFLNNNYVLISDEENTRVWKLFN